MVFVRELGIPALIVSTLVLALGFEIQTFGGQQDTIVWRFALECIVLALGGVGAWVVSASSGWGVFMPNRRILVAVSVLLVAVFLQSPSLEYASARLWDLASASILWASLAVAVYSLERKGLNYMVRWCSLVLFVLLLGSLWAFGTQGERAFLIKSWPLPNPNHVALIAAVHLVFALGNLSHRAQALILGQRFSVLEIVKHKLIWVSAAQVALSAVVLVICESRSVLAISFVAVLILFLNDHFAQLDWVLRDAIRSVSRFSGWFALVLPLLLMSGVALVGVTSTLDSARIRFLLWKDVVVHWLTGDWTRILAGSGWTEFASEYSTWRSWESYYPVTALGPESEWLFVLHSTGIFGLVAVALLISAFRYVRPWSRQLGQLSSNWVARICSTAVLCLAWQSAVDNVFHVPFFWYFSAVVFGGAVQGAYRRNFDSRQEAA